MKNSLPEVTDGAVESKSPPVGHIAQLDGLRAIAIGIVMIAHAGMDRIVPGGFGVSIFFFLSGYLITTLMRSEQNKTGRLDLPAFYLRRALRIMPPLWITLIVTATMMAVAPNWPGSEIRNVDPFGVAMQIFFTTNYANLWNDGIGIPHIPLWSLAVEEHFYIFFPIIFILILARRSPKTSFIILVFGCVLVLGVRFAHIFAGTDPERLYYWSHTRADSIIAGAVLAVYRNPALDGADSWKPGNLALLVGALILLSTFVIRDEIFRQSLRYSLQSVGLFVVFCYILSNSDKFKIVLENRIMKTIGLYSYTLYLFHLFMLEFTYYIFSNLPKIFAAFFAYAAAFLYAALMYKIVDQPIAVLRRSLHRTDRAATQTGLDADALSNPVSQPVK